MFPSNPPRWVQLPHGRMPLHLDLSTSHQKVMHFSKPDPKQGCHAVPKVCRVRKGTGHSMTPDRIRNTARKGNLAQFRLMNTIPQTFTLHGAQAHASQEGCRETPNTRTLLLRRIWDKKQDRWHCSGLEVTVTYPSVTEMMQLS